MDLDLQLAEAITAVRAAYFDADGTVCDYDALAVSREHGRLAACLADLQPVDPRLVRIASRTAFWLNLFNAAVLRDAAELAMAATLKEAEAFFERPRAKVGGLAYSLDDIQHGLLRGNVAKQGRRHAPMSRDDPRLAHMPLAYDERIHFALYCAARSSPALRVFESGRLERELDQAAGDYLRRSVRVESNGAVLVVPRQFKWYGPDFGGAHGIIEFVAAFLDDDAVEAIDRRRGDVKLRYAPFDWVLNRRRR